LLFIHYRIDLTLLLLYLGWALEYFIVRVVWLFVTFEVAPLQVEFSRSHFFSSCWNWFFDSAHAWRMVQALKMLRLRSHYHLGDIGNTFACLFELLCCCVEIHESLVYLIWVLGRRYSVAEDRQVLLVSEGVVLLVLTLLLMFFIKDHFVVDFVDKFNLLPLLLRHQRRFRKRRNIVHIFVGFQRSSLLFTLWLFETSTRRDKVLVNGSQKIQVFIQNLVFVSEGFFLNE